MKSSILDQSSYRIALKRSSRWALFAILPAVALAIILMIFRESVLVAIVPFFPLEADKSDGFYSDLLTLWASEILWLSGFALLAWIIFRTFDTEAVLRWPVSRARRIPVAAACIALAFAGSLVVAGKTLDGFPNSADEYAYLFQAQTYAKGKLWEKPHDLEEFFTFNHIAQKEGVRAGRFPPGWPLLLSTAFYLGIPALLINPMLALIAMVVFYAFAQRFYSPPVAVWATLSLALTSYFIFNAASFFSHISCLLMTLGLVYSLHLHFANGRIIHAILGGFFLGLIITIRYYTAALIFLPFFIYLVWHYRVSVIRPTFWIGAGCLPPVIFLLWYNYSITGNAFLPVTMWAYQNEGLGFVRGHSWLKGVEHIIRWSFMFLYWCSPAFLLMYVVFLWRKIRDKAERINHPEDYTFLLLMTGYFFYYEIGGNQYGPRFFLEAFPFLVLFVVRQVFAHQRRWMFAFFLAGFIFALVKIPFIAYREHRIVRERQDVYRLSRENDLRNAVVLVASPVSVRRPMPIGDLIRNDAGYENSVLYARDIPGRNEALFRYYPGRRFYRYTRDVNDVEGKLVMVGSK